MEWKIIDSAPRNGDDILCFDGDKQIICHWSDYEDDGSSWCTHAFGRQKGWNDWNNEIHHPTHWKKLPEDPKGEFIKNGANQNIDTEYVKMVGGVSEDLKGIGMEAKVTYDRDQLRNIINNYIIFSSMKDMDMERYLNWVFRTDEYLKEIGVSDNNAKDGE